MIKLRHLTILVAVSVVIAIGIVVLVQSSAHAKLCPDGKVAQLSLWRREVTCVLSTPPSRGSRRDSRDVSGSGSWWEKPELPNNSKVRDKKDLPANPDEWSWHEASYYDDTVDQCWGIADPAQYLECQATPWTGGESKDEGAPPPPISPDEAAREVIAKLKFTAAAPQVGPNRQHHDFPFDTAVGYPIWLWTSGGTTQDSVTETVGPLTVVLSIRLDRVVWNMGDGTILRCDRGAKWRRGTAPGKPSPTCGHVYKKAGKYTIETTSRWTITWTAGGQSGTVPYSIAADRPFEVGEIHVLIR